MVKRKNALPPTLAPRLVSRIAAAEYINVSATKFDQLVRDGRMPLARRIDGRKAWDVRELDKAVDHLPDDGDDRTWED